VVISISGCGSKINYEVKPTPLQKNKSTYVLGKFNLFLEESSNKDITNLTYLTQDKLAESFIEKFTNQLKEQGIYGDEYVINIDMYYERVFNIGGNKLNRPQFRYDVKILNKNNELLASYGIGLSTTKYAYFKDAAVNIEISTFNRDAEDEPEDIELICKILVENIKKEIGK
jgi:hypothetical protein